MFQKNSGVEYVEVFFDAQHMWVKYLKHKSGSSIVFSTSPVSICHLQMVKTTWSSHSKDWSSSRHICEPWESWFIQGKSSPGIWPYFRWVKYYNFPRYCWNMAELFRLVKDSNLPRLIKHRGSFGDAWDESRHVFPMQARTILRDTPMHSGGSTFRGANGALGV